MSASRGGCVDTAQDRRLAGRALRSAGHTQAGISRSQYTSKGYLSRLVLKDRQGRCISQSIKRIVMAARTYPEAVDEEKEQRGLTISHLPSGVSNPARDNHSTCCAVS